MAESVAAQVHDDDGRRDVDDPTASVLIASEYALFAQVGAQVRVTQGTGSAVLKARADATAASQSLRSNFFSAYQASALVSIF